ncbi:MAG: ParB N-terminal domain-containing protein [Candidatus Sericytochromatia bacterium]|nr:ParB N-terminal domain-containing protein [Candidatus Tanganyikabacteria bacterium]
MDVATVAPDELDLRLRDLRLSAPGQLARLRSSVERDGIRTPLVVSTGVESGKTVLVDGFKRVRVARELAIEAVPITVLDLDLAAAQVAIVRCNMPHRGLSDLEEAWIVRSLCRQHNLTQVAVGKLLGRDKSWVCRRLKLAEHLDPEVQDEIRLGLLSVSAARELARLPRGNQIPVMQALRSHGLSARQAADLIHALLDTSDPQVRCDLLADPLRYLPAAETPPSENLDPRIGRGANAVRKSLLHLHTASMRLCESRERHAPAGLDRDSTHALAVLIVDTLGASKKAAGAVRQLAADSGLLASDEESAHA